VNSFTVVNDENKNDWNLVYFVEIQKLKGKIQN